MEKKEKTSKRRLEELDTEAVVELLEKWDLSEMSEFAREKEIDGRKLLDVTEGIIKLWRPKVNAKKFIAFIDDLKLNPDKYLHSVRDEARHNEITLIESQYQTVTKTKKVKEEAAISTMSNVEEILKRIVPAKSFLYRNQIKKSDKAPSYLPMDAGTPKKPKKFFRLSSYEYPFLDLRTKFSRQESTDRGYYLMNRNSAYVQKSCSKTDGRPKYKSLSSVEEMDRIDDHFYEDLNYNDIEKEANKAAPLNNMSNVKPCIVKIQEIFQSFKMPFFKKTEEADINKEPISISKEVKVEINEKEPHIYENSDTVSNVYDSVHVNLTSDEAKKTDKTKLQVEEYLEPVVVAKEYCDVSYSYKQRDDSLLGYIMSIFENRFGIRRETNEANAEESDSESHRDACNHDDHKSDDNKVTNMAARPLPSLPVENEAYFMQVDRCEAENLLRGQPDGTFVLRPSSQPNHAYTLTVACADAVHNVGVRRRPDGRYALGFARKGERSFASVTSLLRYHRKRRLLLVAGGGVIGGTTLNECPQYYQTPTSIPVLL